LLSERIRRDLKERDIDVGGRLRERGALIRERAYYIGVPCLSSCGALIPSRGLCYSGCTSGVRDWGEFGVGQLVE